MQIKAEQMKPLEGKIEDKKLYGPRVLELFKANDSVANKDSELNDTLLENRDQVD